jgi:hypothetical protein
VLITMIGGIVATASQARRAEFERAVAEQRFQDVRSLASELVFEVHDAIVDLPGATRTCSAAATRAQVFGPALEPGRR